MNEDGHSPRFTSAIDQAHAEACDAAWLVPLGGLPGPMPDIPPQEGLTPARLARALAGEDEPDYEDELGAIYDDWLLTLNGRPRERPGGPLPDAYRAVLRPLVDHDFTWSTRRCHDVTEASAIGYIVPEYPDQVVCDGCAAWCITGLVRERQGWPCAGCGTPSRNPATELDGAFVVVPGTALARHLAKPREIVIPVLLCAACRARDAT